MSSHWDVGGAAQSGEMMFRWAILDLFSFVSIANARTTTAWRLYNGVFTVFHRLISSTEKSFG